ncbi:MAG TPA: ATP-binding protein [Candidatus Angelobacter sp.]|nr:ATP-binding protein [Candidatus Angelobacter sp.]
MQTGKKYNRPRWFHLPFERRLFITVLLAGAFGVILSLFLLWTNSYSRNHKIEATIALMVFWFGPTFLVYERTVNSLRVLSNIISALEEEDFSFRAAQTVPGDALGDLAIEINNLARALEEERFGALETANLFRNVMAEAGAVIFAFSSERRLRLLNRAAAALLGRDEAHVLHHTAQELGIDDLLDGETAETVTRSFLGIERRWLVRRSHFRLDGIQHLLLVMSEASQALRAEEQIAWQKIVRVLGHEINNSLGPIKSIADTLALTSAPIDLPDPFQKNLRRGLEIIAKRSDSLNRFLQSYTKFAKLSPPHPRIMNLKTVLSDAVVLESRLPITILPSPDVNILIDADQLTQAFINLLRNAVDAVLDRAADELDPDAVTVCWRVDGRDLQIFIRDRGIGLPDTQNLFVPFYTTKSAGSGIGLVLSRQVVESHNGCLTIQNRKDDPGCEVNIKLPMCVAERTNHFESVS